VILLDTHVLIWLVEELPDLGNKARAIAQQAFTLFKPIRPIGF
jgi:PIN domain nuclease of toxin-antitoxin system